MEKPVIIVRYPELTPKDQIHNFSHKLKREDIGDDYYFLFCPTKQDEFNFEIISVKDISELTIEDLQKRLFDFTENI